MIGPGKPAEELQCRRIFRAAGIYVVGAWVVAQVASLVFPAIDVPDAAIPYVRLTVLLLLPLYLVFSWNLAIDHGFKRR